MSRPLRLELSGGLYHVTSRGDRREDIYLNDEDRIAWLDILGAVCKRFNWACHAWCQMSNHYHLVLETPEGNLSQGMRQLNGVYTQSVNRAHQRVGHVFQGRYKAILVEKDAYLLELSRYVVLNPVRAGMVKRPEQWAWSSYRAMLGQADRPAWLHTDWILGQFAARRSRAVEKYARKPRVRSCIPAFPSYTPRHVPSSAPRTLRRPPPRHLPERSPRGHLSERRGSHRLARYPGCGVQALQLGLPRLVPQKPGVTH